MTDLIDDTDKLADAIRGLRPGGGTALYDAIYFACRDKLSQDQPRAQVPPRHGDRERRRRQPEPATRRDQALEMAQKADVVIYAISTNITRVETDGDKILKYLAEETGGQAFFPFKVEDLEQSFENIANELRHQYNIFYRPEPLNTDGQLPTVERAGEGPQGPGGAGSQRLLRAEDVGQPSAVSAPKSSYLFPAFRTGA